MTVQKFKTESAIHKGLIQLSCRGMIYHYVETPPPPEEFDSPTQILTPVTPHVPLSQAEMTGKQTE